MAFKLIIPQSNPIDPSGRVSREWQLFFLDLGNAVVGSGSVTNTTGDLLAGQLVVGNGGVDVKTLPAGTDGYVATMVGGVAAWGAPGGLSAIANQTLLSNISGGAAVPIGNTLSALLDSILGNTQGQIITRNAGTWTVLGPGALGTVLTSGGPGANVSYAASAGGGTQVKGAVWDGGGFSVVAGTALTDVPVYCPDAKTISKVTVLTRGSATGSCVIDIWKRAYSTYPPTVSDTITASALPTITSAIKYQDSTLTGWTTAVSAGDVLMFHVNSCSGFTNISIFLELT